MKYPTSFKDKKYPEFIRKSICLKAYSNSNKVFPKIGLENANVAVGPYIKSVIKNDNEVYEFILFLNKYVNILRKNHRNTNLYALTDRLLYSFDCLGTIENITNLSSYLYKSVIHLTNLTDFLKIKRTSSINDYIEIIKKGASELKLKIPSLSNYDNVFNTPFKNLRLCFSSSGNQGAWDLATMSMRGIKSCMNWKNGNAHSLVGSIIDPYAAIIYISDNSNTKLGISMLARSVVRVVINRKTNKPCIAIEQIYFNEGVLNAASAIFSEKIFIDFIESKTKLKVISNTTGHYIPHSEETSSMDDNNLEEYMTYSDAGFDYVNNKKFYDPNKFPKAYLK